MSDDTNETEATVTEYERILLMHAVGNKPFDIPRNYYCAGVGDPDDVYWGSLVRKGLAREGQEINDGRARYYHVTSTGLAFLRNETPPPPPPPDAGAQATGASLVDQLRRIADYHENQSIASCDSPAYAAAYRYAATMSEPHEAKWQADRARLQQATELLRAVRKRRWNNDGWSLDITAGVEAFLEAADEPPSHP